MAFRYREVIVFSRIYNVARVRARAREILQKDFSRY